MEPKPSNHLKLKRPLRLKPLKSKQREVQNLSPTPETPNPKPETPLYTQKGQNLTRPPLNILKPPPGS